MSLGIDHDVPYQLQEEPGRIMITHKGSLINQFWLGKGRAIWLCERGTV